MAVVRPSSLFSIVLAAAAAGVLFWVSQLVQESEVKKAQIAQSLAHEKEALRVLKAEWDYLNRPDRLEAMAQRYLNMVPVTTETVLRPEKDIPEPLEEKLAEDSPTYVSTQTQEGKKSGVIADPAKAREIKTPVLQSAEPHSETTFDDVLNAVTEGAE